MRALSWFVWMMLLFSFAVSAESRSIAVVWGEGKPKGEISVTGGSLESLSVVKGAGTVTGASRFSAAKEEPFRLEIKLSGSEVSYGPGSAIVTIGAETNPFSVFLRDVSSERPVYIPEYHVAVTDAGDTRSFGEIERAIRALECRASSSG